MAVDRVSFKNVLVEAQKYAQGKSGYAANDEIRFDENTGKWTIEKPESENGMLVVELKNAEYYFGEDFDKCDPEQVVEDRFAKKNGRNSWVMRSIERIKEIEA